MKKNIIKIIIAIVIVILIILIWLLVASLGHKDKSTPNDSINSKTPNAQEAANWDEPFLKPIEVKFLDKEEKAQMGLADDPAMRLQVLERDASGKVTSYKKIRRDEDIIRYVYDPIGIATASASTTVNR